ncbi:MAG: hypothetical protein EON59_16495 [Alphaproteobacteria bacterium]|nr:MAG: hypothetical protein EON59_16495 [Alphaproteobacteria bacterium]
MKPKPEANESAELVATWALSSAARLGSSVRGEGIFLEIRSRLPVAARKWLTIKAGELTLRMPEAAASEFSTASAIISNAHKGIESLPVIPREIEDTLAISTTERHRWLKDGRLPCAGTRTVKLRGRARKITFHVFDPRMVEDILDRAVVDTWREEDAERAAENRRRAAWKAKLTRSQKSGSGEVSTSEGRDEDDRFKLRGWAEFERDGLLR